MKNYLKKLIKKSLVIIEIKLLLFKLSLLLYTAGDDDDVVAVSCFFFLKLCSHLVPE